MMMNMMKKIKTNNLSNNWKNANNKIIEEVDSEDSIELNEKNQIEENLNINSLVEYKLNELSNLKEEIKIKKIIKIF